jgi:5-formyltetrahydrofolate cyclo-ligase
MRERRDALPSDERRRRSRLARTRLAETPWWARARVVAAFHPIGSEIEPLDHPPRGVRRFAFPRVVGRWLEFRCCGPDELQPVPPWNIPEPTPEHPLAEAIDLVLVPGLAFGRDGSRIGYGGGFYDRFLSGLREHPHPPPCVGLGFSIQLLTEVPVGPRDQHLDGVITDEEVIGPLKP